jgi:hypothetical protein
MFSCPEKWIEAFLPDKRKPTDPKHVLTIADWCTYSNIKAILANAGKKVESTQNLSHFPQPKSNYFLVYICYMGYAHHRKVK